MTHSDITLGQLICREADVLLTEALVCSSQFPFYCLFIFFWLCHFYFQFLPADKVLVSSSNHQCNSAGWYHLLLMLISHWQFPIVKQHLHNVVRDSCLIYLNGKTMPQYIKIAYSADPGNICSLFSLAALGFVSHKPCRESCIFEEQLTSTEFPNTGSLH